MPERDAGQVPSYEELQDEVERLRVAPRRALRESSVAWQVARFLWRLEGVRGHWTPPESYGLSWLTREVPAADGAAQTVSTERNGPTAQMSSPDPCACRACGMAEDDCWAQPTSCCVVCFEFNVNPHVAAPTGNPKTN